MYVSLYIVTNIGNREQFPRARVRPMYFAKSFIKISKLAKTINIMDAWSIRISVMVAVKIFDA